MRAIKKAAKKPALKNGPQEFFIGGDESPKTQNIKRLAESGSKVPTVKRRRGKIRISFRCENFLAYE